MDDGLQILVALADLGAAVAVRGDLEDGQRVIVDAEGEGILGEFTFKGEEFEEPAAADKPAEDGAATDGETPADATPATEPAESAPADSGDAPQE